MKENILKLFIEKGFLLDSDMLDFLNELKDEDVANEILNKIALISHEKLITKNLVDNNLEKIKPVLFDLDNEQRKIVEKFFVNISVSVEVKKETEVKEIIVDKNLIKPLVKVLSSPVFAPKKLEVKDFVKHFRNRYNFLKEILQQRNELEGLISIDKIHGNSQNFSIIGIVTQKKTTKNKNFLLEVEDLTGKATLLVTQNKEEIYEKAKEILLDDVIGFKVSGSRDFLFVNDLFYPDSFLREKHAAEEEVYALFISDMHLGAKHFLEKNFTRFIDWLSGKNADEKQKEILKKIRYLFVVGDSIDGAGIYPGQEKDLQIKETMGADLDKIHLDEMKLLAEQITQCFSLRKKHQEYLQEVMSTYCPNLLELAGATIGAGLIDLGKSLKRLALLPASTIQLLGAEKALFRHIKTGSRSPKHGIILNHPLVQKAKRDEKGKAARMLADKLSLCCRLDFFKGELKAKEYRKELEGKLGI